MLQMGIFMSYIYTKDSGEPLAPQFKLAYNFQWDWTMCDFEWGEINP